MKGKWCNFIIWCLVVLYLYQSEHVSTVRWVSTKRSHTVLRLLRCNGATTQFFRRTAKNLVAYVTSWSLTLSPDRRNLHHNILLCLLRAVSDQNDDALLPWNIAYSLFKNGKKYVHLHKLKYINDFTLLLCQFYINFYKYYFHWPDFGNF